jgi:methionine synthase II (cobalamin-independent)
MSQEITSAVWGIAPWSDELLKVSGDVDRGRADAQDYLDQLDEDAAAYFEALHEADIRYTSGGWSGGTKDFFRDTVEASDGFREGIQQAPVTRRFNTNTFFRRPTIEGDLRYAPDHSSGAQAPAFFTFVEGQGEPSVYEPTLLSPYAFARLVDRVGNISEAEAQKQVGNLYDELLEDAEGQGVTHVLFHEPHAPYHQIDKKERGQLKHAIGSLAANHPSLRVGVFFSFGNGAEFVRDFAEDDRIAAIGCDLRKTPVDELPKLSNHRFLAGIVDGANTLIEDDDQLAAELAAVDSAVGARELSVTHTIDLEFVPRNYALQKIAQVGRLARAYEEEIER